MTVWRLEEQQRVLGLDSGYCWQNPNAEAAKDLPVSLYESELHMVDDKPTVLFVSVPFQLETAQVPERHGSVRALKAVI